MNRIAKDWLVMKLNNEDFLILSRNRDEYPNATFRAATEEDLVEGDQS